MTLLMAHPTPRTGCRGGLSGPTPRGLQVLEACVILGGYQEAATALGLSRYTVRAHLVAIRCALGARNTMQAYWIALARGLLEPPAD